ncbi:hypothetical protein ACFFWC_00165 [Plantactinospora siamensis]|uniref:ESX-1 secretion-associated protein n=1 Tax=Plantactinospora siamensis TaxID=555372 RepID=A0ABV6NUW2_9ACTN
MGTTDVLRFPVADVTRHAGTVTQVAEAVARARAAVRAVSMDAGAYGSLCRMLPALLDPAFGAGAAALLRAEDSVRETGAALRTVVAGTVAADGGSAARLLAVGAGRAVPAGPVRELPL